MLRLTLRTLLAWLDGVLPPQEADTFSEKLAASGSARILVDRIRAVVAHPGLDAPKVVGRGLAADANSVAEYLTNSLPADSVAAFERVCIESDAHLAEVASCHRMLVEARNDPRIFEPPEPRELDRLLAKTGSLAPISAKQVRQAPLQPAQPKPNPVSENDGASLSAPSRSTSSIARAEAPKTSRAAWASVVVAVLLVAVLAGALAWRLVPNGLGGSLPRNPDDVAMREPAPADEVEASRDEPALPPDAVAATQARGTEKPPSEPGTAPPGTPARGTPRAGEETLHRSVNSTEQSTPTEQEPPRENGSLAVRVPPSETVAPPETVPPNDTIASGPTAAAGSLPNGAQPAGRVPGGDALAIGAKSPPAPAAEPVKPPPAAATSPKEPKDKDDASTLATVGVTPLLFERVGQAGAAADWAVLPAGATVTKSVDLLVPEGFSPTIAVGKGTIRLIGPARAVLRPNAGDDAAEQPRDPAAEFELVFGRAIVSGIGGGQSLSVVAGSLAGRLDGGDPVGIEVRLERTPGSDPETVPATAIGSIAFPAGGRLSPAPELAANAAGGPAEAGLIRPDGSIATGVVITARGPVASASRDLPDWLRASSPQLLDRLAADSMAASLAAAPTPAALERMLEDSRLENRSLAAATLAMMGRYEPLAELLAADEPGRRLPSRAWEAVERATIPLALARGPASAGRLLAALESVVPPDAAKLVRQLAVGFSNEAVVGGGEAVLVASLEHPSLLVRRLALARLVETVPLTAADRLRYRPDGPADARAEAVKWWRTQLEKGRIRRGGEGGLSKAEGE